MNDFAAGRGNPVDHERIAELAKALAHPARVQIVELLSQQSECKGAELFAELPLAQSTVSEHVRILRDAGLVGAKQVGASSVYCLDPSGLHDFAAAVGAMAATRADCSAGGQC